MDAQSKFSCSVCKFNPFSGLSWKTVVQDSKLVWEDGTGQQWNQTIYGYWQNSAGIQCGPVLPPECNRYGIFKHPSGSDYWDIWGWLTELSTFMLSPPSPGVHWTRSDNTSDDTTPRVWQNNFGDVWTEREPDFDGYDSNANAHCLGPLPPECDPYNNNELLAGQVSSWYDEFLLITADRYGRPNNDKDWYFQRHNETAPLWLSNSTDPTRLEHMTGMYYCNVLRDPETGLVLYSQYDELPLGKRTAVEFETGLQLAEPAPTLSLDIGDITAILKGTSEFDDEAEW